jgi:hypothetical protein
MLNAANSASLEYAVCFTRMYVRYSSLDDSNIYLLENKVLLYALRDVYVRIYLQGDFFVYCIVRTASRNIILLTLSKLNKLRNYWEYAVPVFRNQEDLLKMQISITLYL